MQPPDDVFNLLKMNADGLIPVITQQFDTGEVLMMAWMNRTSLEKTLLTGELYYWSRSRQSLWKKGETSGQTQVLKTLLVDCDGDTLLAKVDQQGVACHTGRRSCFYQMLEKEGMAEIHPPVVSPETLYKNREE